MDEVIKKHDFEYCGKGMHKITAEKLAQSQGAVFLDLRSDQEVKALNLDLSCYGIDVIHIPLHLLPENLDKLPKDRLIVTFCSGGTRSAWAYVYLLSKGYEKVKWFEGGYSNLLPLFKTGAVYKRTKEEK